MSEWWTYSPADFLLFSPKTYYRLFEIHNAAVWPGHIAALVLGLFILGMLLKPGARQGRIIASIIAACWLWVAWAWFFTRYATINWAAVYFAAAFVIEAVLLIVFGVIGNKLPLAIARRSELAGAALFGFALAIQPLTGPLLGRQWSQIEIFGVMPNPTVVATLAILGVTTHWTRWLLLVVPVMWCMVSGATEWAMASPDAWIMPLALAIGLALAASRPARDFPI